jgi:hypothetical protein
MNEDDQLCAKRDWENNVLMRAIQKAEKNGFDNKNITVLTHGISARLYVRFLMCEEFAKPFWGEEEIAEPDIPEHENRYPLCWQYHLQQIVLEKEPLKYLEQFLQ